MFPKKAIIIVWLLASTVLCSVEVNAIPWCIPGTNFICKEWIKVALLSWAGIVIQKEIYNQAITPASLSIAKFYGTKADEYAVSWKLKNYKITKEEALKNAESFALFAENCEKYKKAEKKGIMWEKWVSGIYKKIKGSWLVQIFALTDKTYASNLKNNSSSLYDHYFTEKGFTCDRYKINMTNFSAEYYWIYLSANKKKTGSK